MLSDDEAPLNNRLRTPLLQHGKNLSESVISTTSYYRKVHNKLRMHQLAAGKNVTKSLSQLTKKYGKKTFVVLRVALQTFYF